MIILIGDSGQVTLPCGDLIGCMGENVLRTHKVMHPKFGSAYYTMKFVYGDGSYEEAYVTDGVLVMTEQLLHSVGRVSMQFQATLVENTDVSIFRSEIFSARIGESLSAAPEES